MATPATSSRMTRAQAKALGLEVAATPLPPPTTRRAAQGTASKAPASTPVGKGLRSEAAEAAALSPLPRAFGTPIGNVLKQATPGAAQTPETKLVLVPAAEAPATPVLEVAVEEPAVSFEVAPPAALAPAPAPASTPSGPTSISALLAVPDTPCLISPRPAAASPSVSPLPEHAVHALPFVPRALAEEAAPPSPSLSALRKAYKAALVGAKPRLQLVDAAGNWSGPPGAPAPLPSRKTAAPKERTALSTTAAARERVLAAAAKAGTVKLAGQPAFEGTHIRFGSMEAVPLTATLVGVPAFEGKHTRFD